MKSYLIAAFALACSASPAFADVCSASSEAAAREALKSADAAGLRTATVRVTCDGKPQTFVIHRIGGAGSSTVTVREVVKSPDDSVIDAREKSTFGNASPARLIRVGE